MNPSAPEMALTPVTSRREVLAATASLIATAALGCKKGDATEDAIGPTVEATALSARLGDVAAGRVAVFYVGPDMLFDRGHVPGARRLPPVESKQGEQALARAVAETPAGVEIVVYCGCCPYRSCPNVRPASRVLRASGRADARLLDLPTSFRADWMDKGLPVEKG